MSETSLQNISPEEKESALVRMLRATTTLPAQVTFHATALGALALMAGADLPPALAMMTDQVGVNKLSDILGRVARGEGVADEEVREEVQRAITESGIANLLTAEEFQHGIAGLESWQRVLALVIRYGEQRIIERLAEQGREYRALMAVSQASIRASIAELQASIMAEHRTLATREQVKEINKLLEQLMSAITGPKPQVPLQKPARAEHFTGREGELARLLAELGPGRVVTLCGPGGIGKSALAAEAIWTLAPGDDPPERFPDGIICYNFYWQPQAALALEHVVRAYGEEPRPTPRDAAGQALDGRQALLVLDGAEQADDLPGVLAVRGNCGVLVTSRGREETEAERQDIAPLEGDEAVALLRAWGGEWAADEEAAGRICELVGGLPLAVRLAGRYLAQRQGEAADYVAWLEETPLTSLDQGERGHESVPLLLGRSLARVSEGARLALAVAGVLALAPFGREVVEAALTARPVAPFLEMIKGNCGRKPAEQTIDVRRALGELVNYGLLLRSGERYQAGHALIHTYARRHMAPPDEAMERMAAYYDAFAREQRELGVEGYQQLDAERAHLLEILAGCVEGKEWGAARGLAWAVGDYLDSRGHWTEAVTALKAGATAAQGVGHRRDEGAFLGNLGSIYHVLGQVEKAIEYHGRALAIHREAGYRRDEGNAWGNLGTAYHHLGQVERAVNFYENSLAIACEIGDRRSEGIRLSNLGTAYRDLGQVGQAWEHLRQALAIFEEIKSPEAEQVRKLLAELERGEEEGDRDER